jgi:methionyl-tRNA formyltransferase
VRLVEPGKDPVRVKIHRTRVVDRGGSHGAAGTIVRGLEIACGEGIVELLELQLEGKRKLGASEFLAGRRLAAGARFERETGA